MKSLCGYCRVSTDRQARESCSLAKQESEVRAYAAYLLTRLGSDYRLGEIYVEREGVSAREVPLKRRPAGSRMCEALRPGDQVIFSRIDRCFRSLSDFCSTKSTWDERDITTHCADTAMDLSTPHGKFFVSLMAVFAENESTVISERVKGAYRYMFANGKTPPNIGLPPGLRHAENNVVEIDQDRASLMRLCYLRRTKDKWSRDKICDYVEDLVAQREGREPKPRYWAGVPGRTWSERQCEIMYLYWPSMRRYRRDRFAGKSVFWREYFPQERELNAENYHWAAENFLGRDSRPRYKDGYKRWVARSWWGEKRGVSL